MEGGLAIGELAQQVSAEAKRLLGEAVPIKYVTLALLNSSYPLRPDAWRRPGLNSERDSVLFRGDPQYVAAAIAYLKATAAERKAQVEFESVRTKAPPGLAVTLQQIGQDHALCPPLSRQEVWDLLREAGFKVAGFCERLDYNGQMTFMHQYADEPEIRAFAAGPLRKLAAERQIKASRLASGRPPVTPPVAG